MNIFADFEFEQNQIKGVFESLTSSPPGEGDPANPPLTPTQARAGKVLPKAEFYKKNSVCPPNGGVENFGSWRNRVWVRVGLGLGFGFRSG